VNGPRSPACDSATASRPAEVAGAWSEAVAPCQPQSPLLVAFTPHPATLRLSGVIDESTHCLLTDALCRAAQNPERDLLIDLSEVEFCDLGGVRAIMSVATRPDAPRWVTLTGLPAETRTVIHILGWQAAPGVMLA
jgi:anti-anti-sigma regulatory factor